MAGEAGETPNSRARSRAASIGSGSGTQESANWAKVTADGEYGDVDDMGDTLSSSPRCFGFLSLSGGGSVGRRPRGCAPGWIAA